MASTLGLGAVGSVIFAPAGPVHNKVAPGVIDAPFKVTFETVQVSNAGFLSISVMSGGALSAVTVTFFDAVHPLVLFVMVKV